MREMCNSPVEADKFMIQPTYSLIPVPHDLRHLVGTDAPEMIGTHEVARLLEHWGFARDGRGGVRKLVGGQVLHLVKLRNFTGWRFSRVEVLALYTKERA